MGDDMFDPQHWLTFKDWVTRVRQRAQGGHASLPHMPAHHHAATEQPPQQQLMLQPQPMLQPQRAALPQDAVSRQQEAVCV